MNVIHCPVCCGQDTRMFLHWPGVPTHQNCLVSDAAAARGIRRGDLCIHCCLTCGFVFNAGFDPGKVSYHENYDNTQTYSPRFRQHVENLVETLVIKKGVRNKQIVEIGCGKGQFLRGLVEFEGGHNRGIGFDPSYLGPQQDLGGRIVFEKRYYDATCTVPQADVVISRHVIEHIPEPMEFLRTLRRALKSSGEVSLFLETPCVEWIFENQVWWDFFYEHCSYFSRDSLRTALERSGFHVKESLTTFGGQYIWMEAVPAAKTPKMTRLPLRVLQQVAIFQTELQRSTLSWSVQIQELARKGNLALWGAGAKGMTFANLVDPECRWISCVVDINPSKQGNFLPGTGHPIVGPDRLEAFQVASVLITNPNYRQEIADMLARAGLETSLVDLMEFEARNLRQRAA